MSSSPLHCIKKTPDFTFCNVSKRKYHEKYDHEGETVAIPSPLWPRTVHSSYNFPCPTTRLQAMIDARKHLMEMINSMPESSFELSLKDIVVEDQDQENLEIVFEKEAGVTSKPECNRRKKVCRKGPISRSVSLDTGVFLLKMFIPSSLGLKKPKVYRSSSMGRPMNRFVGGDWWKMKFYLGNRNSCSSNSSGSSHHSNSGSTSSKTNSDAERITKTGNCWFINKTWKPKNQRGCLF